MKKHLLAGAVVAGLITLATSAHAVPIAAGSTLSLSGSDSYTPTSITFTNPASIGGESGSFTVLANCAGCVLMTATTFTAASPPATLYTATEPGPITSSLNVTSALFTYTDGALPSLMVTGSGTLTLTGFDPTPGDYNVTTQGPSGVTVTFSVTSLAVPEPASLAILGGALAGLGLFGKRRRKAA